MKLASALLSFLYATLAASSTLTFWGKDQNTLAAEDTVKVPGKNPLTVSTPAPWVLRSQTLISVWCSIVPIRRTISLTLTLSILTQTRQSRKTPSIQIQP